MKQSLEKVNRKIETTRIENWSVPGVPDVLCCNEHGDFSFLELKIVKKIELKYQPIRCHGWLGILMQGVLLLLVAPIWISMFILVAVLLICAWLTLQPWRAWLLLRSLMIGKPSGP